MSSPAPKQLESDLCSILVSDRRVALDFRRQQPRKCTSNPEDDDESEDDCCSHRREDDDGGDTAPAAATAAMHAAAASAGYTALSSAVLNGGLRTFSSGPTGSGTTTTTCSSSSGTTCSSSSCGGIMHVLNYKVPPDYDGITPNPTELLRRVAAEEGFDPDATVGMMTAASMSTLRTASRSAGGGGDGDDGRVVVEAIVTAGISNSRTAGADADYFLFNTDDNNDDGGGGGGDDSNDGGGGTPSRRPGTINTVVVTNASLSPAAIVEAYAIAVEAKCAACADVGIVCAKTGKLAQGTGTDATVVICLSRPEDDSADNGDGNGNNGGSRHPSDGNGKRRLRVPVSVEHAGKHTLFAELLGQAVREATTQSLLTNIHYMHGNRAAFAAKRWSRRLGTALLGSRPCVPPRPMMPVPWAPPSVLCIGLACVALALAAPAPPPLYLPPRHPARILLAVVAWDRCLGEVPLRVHPVVIVGNLISAAIRHTPDGVFTNPALGFVCGLALLVAIPAASIGMSWLILSSANAAAAAYADDGVVGTAATYAACILEVLIVKSSLSLQLLCTIALQMAKFLERRQIKEAREQLSWLCSRDPSTLNASDLAGGTLESLSENLSDGFVAPLFWFALCGPLGAVGYRTVNTLDSRVGYRNDKFEWFGKPSARFDDLLNLAPARITAVLLSVAALAVRRCDAARGFEVAWRDCSQCDSPNAGWPMGAMAGLLGVRLEKKGQYCLGGSKAQPPDSGSIRTGHRVAQLAGGLSAIVAVVVSAFLQTGS